MGLIVIACYRPKPGHDAETQALVKEHTPILRSQGLATDRTPIVGHSADGTIVEVFEWVSREAIESAHTNPTVLAMWDRFGKVCDYVKLSDLKESANLFAEFGALDAA
ncbi:MAG: hypothetical protein IPK82_31765 [Polyangiaceae bacterium]|nr:hypothetical protein [Polyangiaceae bacterium]